MEFTTLYQKVEEAIAEVANSQSRYDRDRASVTATDTELNDMPTKYAEVNTEVNAGAVANPDDAGWQGPKSKKDYALLARKDIKAMTNAGQTCFQKIDDFDAAAVHAARDARRAMGNSVQLNVNRLKLAHARDNATQGSRQLTATPT